MFEGLKEGYSGRGVEGGGLVVYLPEGAKSCAFVMQMLCVPV